MIDERECSSDTSDMGEENGQVIEETEKIDETDSSREENEQDHITVITTDVMVHRIANEEGSSEEISGN